MAKITRYSGNLKAFAENSTGTKRTIFGDITQANDLDSNINTDFLAGWELIDETSDFPTIQDFNALGYTHGQLLSYLHQVGVPEWSGLQEYHEGSIANRAGVLYVCQTNAHISATAPESDTTNWLSLAASGVSYDNTTSGLSSETAQAAIDELADFAQDLAENPATTTGLTWGWLAGQVRSDNVITDVAAGTILLTDNATNYVEYSVILGMTVNQSGFTQGAIPIRTVVTLAGVQTSTLDKRAWLAEINVPATTTTQGTVELADSTEAAAGTDAARALTPATLRNGLNATGGAPIYACRAWVNFNGIYTVAIRASGNVSSITDNGVGTYTVNFTTAMPDANYSVHYSHFGTSSATGEAIRTYSTTSVGLFCGNNDMVYDSSSNFVSIVR